MKKYNAEIIALIQRRIKELCATGKESDWRLAQMLFRQIDYMPYAPPPKRRVDRSLLIGRTRFRRFLVENGLGIEEIQYFTRPELFRLIGESAIKYADMRMKEMGLQWREEDDNEPILSKRVMEILSGL